VCLPGLYWNSYACGAEFWFDDCRALANQLTAEEQSMQLQSGGGDILHYELLRKQYEQCMQRYGYFDPFMASLLDTP
jgi:hypothetical protein